MKLVVIDTNALISFVTDRNLAQQEKVAALFEASSHLKVGILCHQNVLTEFVFVMERVYAVPKETINAMIADFIALPGVEIVHDLDYKVLLALWPAPFVDFGDAILAVLCKSRKNAALVSFDERFAKSAVKIGLKIHPI